MLFASNVRSAEVGVVQVGAVRRLHLGNDSAPACCPGWPVWRIPRHVPRVSPLLPSTGERVGTIQRRIVNAGLPWVSAIFCAPSSVCRSMYTVFEDCSVAVRKVHVSQILAAVAAHRFGDARERPVRVAVEVCVEGRRLLLTAASNANGSMVEPTRTLPG